MTGKLTSAFLFFVCAKWDSAGYVVKHPYPPYHSHTYPSPFPSFSSIALATLDEVVSTDRPQTTPIVRRSFIPGSLFKVRSVWGSPGLTGFGSQYYCVQSETLLDTTQESVLHSARMSETTPTNKDTPDLDSPKVHVYNNFLIFSQCLISLLHLAPSFFISLSPFPSLPPCFPPFLPLFLSPSLPPPGLPEYHGWDRPYSRAALGTNASSWCYIPGENLAWSFSSTPNMAYICASLFPSSQLLLVLWFASATIINVCM